MVGSYQTTNGYTQITPNVNGASVLDSTQSFVVDSLDKTNATYGAWTHTWNYPMFFGSQTIWGANGDISRPNDGTTGTVFEKLAKINASGNAVEIQTTDTAIPVYIVESATSTTGYAQMAVIGNPLCIVDAAGATINDFAVASSTTRGACHDAGATTPSGTFVIGQFTSTCASGVACGVSLYSGSLTNGAPPLAATLVTTAATTNTVTVTGMTSSGHCALEPTNAAAATNIATTYVSAKTTNQITVTHVATASMNYDVLCTAY